MIMKLDGGHLGRSLTVIMADWSLEQPGRHDHGGFRAGSR